MSLTFLRTRAHALARALALATATSAAALAATPVAAEDGLKVVASFSILGDMAAEVGGERVSITTLVGANGDAHVYEPTPSDARAVAEADLVLVNGLGFEGWLDRLVESAGYAGPVVVASEGMALLHSPEHHDEHHGEEHDEDGEERGEDEHAAGEDEHHHGEFDPHGWHDLNNGRRYVHNIARALAAADPEGASSYRAQTVRYIGELEAVDGEIRALLAAIPVDQRKVITSHDAFRYFGHAYGVEFLAPVGLSTESEPSAKDLAELIRQMRADDVRALFVDNISDPRLIEQLAREADGTLGGTMYSDSLSDASEPAASYLSMMRHNARQIAAALAPATKP